MVDDLIRLIKTFKKPISATLVTAGLVTISGYWWEPYLQAGLKKYFDLDIPGLTPLIVVALGMFLVLLGVYVHFHDKATEQNNRDIISRTMSPLKDQQNLSEEIQDYCAKIETLHNEIILAGFKTKLRIPILIEDIFVPLRALLDLRPTGRMCFGGSEDAEEHLQECGKVKEISLVKAFHEMRELNRQGIVILGDPGSGKTTHLKRLLLWCLHGGLSRLGLPEDMLPVFLPLRELKDLTAGLSDFIQSQLNQRHLKTPDGFGERMLKRGNLLYMHVWEWCHDWYGENYYADSPSVDPAGPDTDVSRVFRGGSWVGDAVRCRSAYRHGCWTVDRSSILGFRLASFPGQQSGK